MRALLAVVGDSFMVVLAHGEQRSSGKKESCLSINDVTKQELILLSRRRHSTFIPKTLIAFWQTRSANP